MGGKKKVNVSLNRNVSDQINVEKLGGLITQKITIKSICFKQKLKKIQLL